MDIFAKLVECIQPLTVFIKCSILGISQGYEYGSNKTKPKPTALSSVSQELRFVPFLNSSLSPHYYLALRLLITSSINVTDFKLIHLCSWVHMVLTSHHLPVQTHRNNSRSTLSNFFGECKEMQSKLIVLTFLEWVWVPSVSAKSFCD